MASYIDLNDLGSFANIEALWAAHPEGGQEGDYCTIDGVKYRWDKYDRMWVANPNYGPTHARKVETFYGDVNFQNNVTVAGTIRAKGVKQPCVGLFASVPALEAAYPTPEVGMWAVVGDTMPGPIYSCSTAGVWAPTGENGGVDEIDLTDYAHVEDVEELSDEVEAIKDSILEDVEYDITSDIVVSDHNWSLNGGVGAVVDATPRLVPDWSCMRIAVTKGDTIDIYTIGGITSARAWALTDSTRKILAAADPAEDQQAIEHYTVTATQGGFLYVNCSSVGYSSFEVIHHTNTIIPRINALESLRDDVDTIKADLYNLVNFDSSDLEEGETGQYWKLAADGSPVSTAPSAVSTYTALGYWACVPEPIPIKEGDIVTISTAGGSNARAWAFTDNENNLLANDEDHYYVADANENTTANPVTITAEQSGYLYVNFNLQTAIASNFYVRVNEIVIDNLTEKVDTLSETVDGLVKNAAGIPHYKNNPLPLWKDTLKVLAIGNSYSEDLTAYLGELIGSSGADLPLSKICVYMLKQSSASLQTWVENYEDSEITKSITRMAGSITMSTTTGTVAQLLAQDWDVVIIQQLSTYSNRYNTFNPYLTKMIGYIRENCTNQQVALAWQSVWSYKEGYTAGGVTYGDSEERWAEICAATKQMMHKDGIDIVIPTGTAIQNARAYQVLNPTFNAGNTGEVTRDGTHLEYGVGRYIAACTFFQTLISPMFGVSVLGNPAVHTVTQSEQDHSQNVYGAVSVDNNNKGLCQLFAYASTINNWSITDVEDESFTTSIFSNTPSIYDRVGTLETEMPGKQTTLVSGTNIKTINNQSLLGSGNINIQGGGGSGEQSDWNETDASSLAYIKNKPSLATVATSGSYSDLSNKPTIPDAQIQADWNQSTTTAKDYIKNKPTIPAAQVQSNWSESDTSSKAYIQNKPTIPTVPTNVSAFTNDAGYLTSHQSLKTINSTSLVGSGNMSLAEPVAVISVSGATPTQTLVRNTFYKFTGAVTSLTLTLGSEVSGITNIYAFSFVAGADNPTISISPSVTIADAPDIHSGDYVEFNIMDGKAIAKVWAV